MDTKEKEAFAERVRDLLRKTGLRPSELAAKAEEDRSVISNMLSARRIPGRDKIQKLATVLGVSTDYLYGRPSNIDIVKLLPSKRIPVVSFVRAGGWHDSYDPFQPGVADEFVSFDCHDTSAFACRVEGDSMKPEYEHGDIIICSPAVEAQIGDDVIAKWDDQVSFKRLQKREDGLVLLSPLNPAYDSWVITAASFRIIGPVIGLQRAIKRKKK